MPQEELALPPVVVFGEALRLDLSLEVALQPAVRLFDQRLQQIVVIVVLDDQIRFRFIER